jgi:xanthine dehydrogenase accessory factor
MADGQVQGTIGGGQVERFATQDALECLEKRVGGVFSYSLTTSTGQCCGGSVEVFMEVLNLNPQLYVYGAGHVGQALCQTLEGTAFTTHIIDTRTEWVKHPALPEGVVSHQAEWREYNSEAEWSESRTYAAVMTPDHSEDLDVLMDLLRRPMRFLGLIGSRPKWKQFQIALRNEGFQQAELDRVHCPIGIGNTGKAPREIAVSIAAEILTDYYHVRQNSSDSSRSREIESAGHTQRAENSR